MNFARPWALYLLALAPALAVFFWFARARNMAMLRRFGDPELLERAGLSASQTARSIKQVLLVCALALLVFSFAGPQWGATREKIERKGVDIVVVLDTSLSMNARDVAPSRMAKSKMAIENLINLMKGDRIAIVAFAGTAYTMCPLTLDYGAALMFLDIIAPDIVPQPGTDIVEALEQGARNFDESAEKYKVMVLISDGEDLGDDAQAKVVETAEKLADTGVAIFTVGVGDPSGSSIPVETEDGIVDKTDRSGNVVITRLDEETLRKVALAAGGKYRRIDNRASGGELAEIYDDIASMEKKTFDEDFQIHYEDRFQYFLGAGLLLLLIEAAVPDRSRRARKARRPEAPSPGAAGGGPLGLGSLLKFRRKEQ